LIGQSIHHHHHHHPHSINILHGMSSCYAYEKSLKTLSGMVMEVMAFLPMNSFCKQSEFGLEHEYGQENNFARFQIVYLKHEDERIVIVSFTLLHT
jgi:hypothetical protein